MLLVTLSPVAQLLVEVVHRIRVGSWANLDLASVFPEITARLRDAGGDPRMNLLLDLLVDMWLFLPAMVALIVVWAVHGAISALLA